MFNTVIISGRPVKDPEIKQLPNGGSVAQFSIAYNRSYKPKNSEEWVNEAHYFDIEVFGNQIEKVKKGVKKGVFLHIEGSLRQDRWETQAGEKRSKIKIRAEKIEITPKSESNSKEKPEE